MNSLIAILCFDGITSLRRSGNQHNQHNHHSQQRINYGQNRPNFHNGSHNMHNVANMSTNIGQSQPKINKVDANCGIPLHSNAQHRYKSIDAANLANQSSSALTTTSSHPVQKVPIQLASNKENVQNVDRNDINRGCVEDSTNAMATSTASSKAKTPMCLINELVRSNKVCYWVNMIFFHLVFQLMHSHFSAVEASISCDR